MEKAVQPDRRGHDSMTSGHDCVSIKCMCMTLSLLYDMASSVASTADTGM